MSILIKLALLLFTITLFACGSSTSSGNAPDGNAPDGGGSGETPTQPLPRISIADATGEEGGNITFTVTTTPSIAKQVSFDYKVVFDNPLTSTSANASDLAGDISGKITIATTDSSVTISIATTNDNLTEPNETFQIQLSGLTPTDATFSNNKATGAIIDNNPDGFRTKIDIADATGEEGGSLVFQITTQQIITEPVAFNYQLNFSQTADESDLNLEIGANPIIIIAANSSGTTISIPIKDDNLREQAETFRITLNNLSLNNATFGRKTAVGTIVANDPIEITINNVTGVEGSIMNFKVASTQNIAEQISFSYDVIFDNPPNLTSATTSDLDSRAISGSKRISAKDSSTTISVQIVDDKIRELSEKFRVILSDLRPASSDVTFINNVGIGTILDGDEADVFKIFISPATANEASGEVVFKVISPFPATPDRITFDYEATVDNPISATTSDFIATSGVAIIEPGEFNTNISITIATDDNIKEDDKTFRLLIKNFRGNATLDNLSVTGTILNDDPGEVINLEALAGDRAAIFHWTNPIASNILAGIAIAQTRGKTAPSSCENADIIIDAMKKTSHTVTALANNTNYSFRICTKNNVGLYSDGLVVDNLLPFMLVDDDGDGLIDIADATQLNNIRYNLAGTGYQTSSTVYPAVAGCPNNRCSGYELTTSLDLSSFGDGTWDAIGSIQNRFTATFDGRDYTISGLTANGVDYVGLFGAVRGASIRNLKMTDVSINGGSVIGALAGSAINSIVSNIELIGDANQTTSDVEIKGSGNTVGGLIGSFTGTSGTITDSFSSLTVRGSNNTIGGLVGFFENGKIQNSNSIGNVSSSGSNIGGLVGWQQGGSISQSWSSGNVSSSASIVGGLVGRQIGNISQVWASGAVSGRQSIGGLVGEQQSDISQSWASGAVSGSSENIGGLVGLGSNSRINGRNYRVNNGEGVGIGLNSITNLANLSGTSGSDITKFSGWHAGFGNDLKTRYCDSNRNDRIDDNEQTADNTVWVMQPQASDLAAPNTNQVGEPANYYRIPAIRCIGNTPAKRQANINKQRILFPRPLPPTITIADATAAEGQAMSFKITADKPFIEIISFDYQVNFTSQLDSASREDLSSPLAGSGLIAVGDSSTVIEMQITNDIIKEQAETFYITLSNLLPLDASFTKTEAVGIIASSDNDSRFVTGLSISDATTNEGENLIFTVVSYQAITQDISFSYSVDFDNPLSLASASTADFVGITSGSKTITANSTDNTIVIQTVNDIFKEQAESFRVILSDLSLADATFFNNIGIGTIATSDSNGVKTNIRITNDVGLAGTNEGENITFRVTATPQIAEPIIFSYNIDFTNEANSASSSDLSPTTGSATIAANSDSTTISILAINDNIRENKENFRIILDKLSLSDATFTDNISEGAIIANDATGLVTISIADATANEDSGQIFFKVSSNFPTTSTIKFNYEAIIDDSLTNPARNVDLGQPLAGIQTIATNDSSTTVSISVIPDSNITEANETFRLLLTKPVNAVFDNSSAIGTIINDNPGDVSNVTATADDRQVTLNWTNPNNSFFEGTVIVYAINTTPGHCSNDSLMVNSPATSGTITGLVNDTNYSFRLCAINNTRGIVTSGITVNNIIPRMADKNGNGLIEISNAAELNNVRYNLDATSYKTKPNEPGITSGCPVSGCNGYELDATIDLQSFANWEPIGSKGNEFKAIFDGGGNMIDNLTINRSHQNYTGLFSTIKDATVMNFNLKVISVFGSDFVGAVVGEAIDSTLSNIELIGDDRRSSVEVRGVGRVGGLVGYLISGAISNASNINMTVRGIGKVGGLAGVSSGLIRKSSNLGFISADKVRNPNNFGGLVGSLEGGDIILSWNRGDVFTIADDSNYFGGLVGAQRGGNIIKSWSTGYVYTKMIYAFGGRGSWFFGGLVGAMFDGTISQSWASGRVFTSQLGTSFYGGLVGQQLSGNIRQSWSSGPTFSTFHDNVNAGGLAGSKVGGSIIQAWTASDVSNIERGEGGFIGQQESGPIYGRNYQLDNDQGTGVDLANGDGMGVSFILGIDGDRAAKLTALANLTGLPINSKTSISDWQTNSGWHAGFDLDNLANETASDFDLETKFCDTNGNGEIDGVADGVGERLVTNTVWVMSAGGLGSDLAAPTTNEAGQAQNYYWIPALRCIGETPAERNANIDLQRRQFPTN